MNHPLRHLGTQPQLLDVRRSTLPSPVRLRPIFQRLRPDLYHHPNFTLPIGAPTPCVVTIYDAVQQVVPASFIRRTYQLGYFRLMTHSALRRATSVIAISRLVAEGITERFGLRPDRITIVEPGVGREFRRPIGGDQLLRTKLSLGLPDAFILYVGTNWPHKNVKTLIRAFAAVADRIPHQLVLAGAPVGEATDIDRLVRESNVSKRVLRIGFLSEGDLAVTYRLADVYVLCSLFEGFGLGVLEAMASGTAVICSRQASVAREVGDAVWQVNATSVEEIASALLNLGTNGAVRDRLAHAGQMEAARYTWERAAALTVNTYERALRKAAS